MRLSLDNLIVPRLTIIRSLLLLGLLMIIGLLMLFVSSSLFQGYDYLIVNIYRYVEGEEITTREHVVGIRGDRIAYIGTRKPFPRVNNVIDGKGLIMAPGFLDINSAGFVKAKAAYFKAHDGVTTYLSAHGGLPGKSMQTYGEDTYLNYATTIGIIGFRDLLDKQGFSMSFMHLKRH